MTWREELLPASINGIAIEVPNHRRRGGRSTSIHEFLARDDILIEDQGRAPRRFTLTAFIHGDDYLVGRDDLIALLEDDPGPYTLIHPYFGLLIVRQESEYELAEDTLDGGVARFTLNFAEHTPPPFPLIRVPSGDIPLVIIALGIPFGLSALSRMNPGRFAGALTSALAGANSLLRVVKGKIGAKLALLDGLDAQLDELDSNIAELISTPDQFAAEFLDIATSTMAITTQTPIEDVEANLDDAARILALFEAARTLGAFRNTETIPPPTTPNNLQEAEALEAADALVQQANLMAVASAMLSLKFSGKQQAIDALETMTLLFEPVLLDPGLSEELFDGFQQLQASVTDFLATQAQDLPNVSTFTPKRTRPALVIAYQLYQDANLDADIVERNNLPDPNQVPGGVPIETLTDA